MAGPRAQMKGCRIMDRRPLESGFAKKKNADEKEVK
jgi:hypothetical protein